MLCTPLPRTPTTLSPRQLTPLMNYESHHMTWNASSFNICHARHPQYSDLLTHTLSYHIYTRGQTYYHQILETPTRLITVYRLFFNSTRAMHQITTYGGYKGGLLMLIHYKRAYSNKSSTTTTYATISSFLQLIHIAN